MNKELTMNYYDTFQSPHGGMLLVASDEGLAGVFFNRQKYFRKPAAHWKKAPRHPVLRQAKRELAEYFAGKRRDFSVALCPEGTGFQKNIWQAIAGVAYGETITYAELARRAGCPGSARAAGAATGRNPIGIIVPCHRIVGSSGLLTGYAGGLAKKRALLALEAEG
ncbi:MAG TPA: methylated-DNA--[protein]-cysteine S-methyltransferase [Burkholderiales bacterium]|nr:methylated-DNA--[protein]-cysteine S-methyltransferase [Burkholderiales bacterium]